jgi:pimeloyl-ACP methyl ester carboxylesterase
LALAAQDAVISASAMEAAVQPETKYAQLGGDRVAYQVVGHGPPDLVMTTASFGDIDVAWEDPGLALFYRTLASFSRLILLNRRGTGASDPLPPDPLPPWESYAEELAVILDEVGSQRAALLATLDAGPTALFFAATRPSRTSALILAHTTAKCMAADDYPIGVPVPVAEAVLGQVDQLWGLRRWPPRTCRAGPATYGFAGGSPNINAPGPVLGWSRGSCGRSWRPMCAPSSR